MQKEKKQALLVMGIGAILCVAMTLLEFRGEREGEAAYLERNPYGAGAYEEEMRLRIEGEPKKKVEVQVEERQYSKEEARDLIEKTKNEVKEKMLGKNKDAAHIFYPLEFMTKSNGSPVQISWTTTRPEVLDWEGKQGEDIPKEGISLTVQAELLLGEESSSYEQEVRVYPPIYSEQEELDRQIKESILLENQEKEEGERLYLPGKIEGKKVTWSKVPTYQGMIILAFSIVIGVLLVIRKQREKEEKEESRQEQMLLDYPDIISKMLLFLGAGMTIQSAFEKIAWDYKKQKTTYKREKREAYEQLLCTTVEMEGGMSQREAYERFASRCISPIYRTFALLLIQNVKRGTKGLVELLEQESIHAQEERKRRAKVLGEQAGTKLLFPMLLMLIVVLIILMVPACLSFYAG